MINYDDAPLLEMQNVSVRQNANTILDAVSLTIEQGCHAALLGANGSGKSTLVKLIERRLYPLVRDPHGREVRMRVLGHTRWQVGELRKLLGVVSGERQVALAQDAAALTAYDVVVSGFFAAHGLWLDMQPSAEQRAQAYHALELMGAAHLAERTLKTLSTGEGRRVIIARALVHRPRALLLDEPCAGLDLVARQAFLERLRALLRDTNMTLLMVTHHAEELIPEIERVVMLKKGQILADGQKTELVNTQQFSALFGAPVEVSARGAWFDAHLSAPSA